MTTATSPDIINSYRKHFSLEQFTDEDKERICFLERIASGEIPIGDTPAAVAAQTVREWYENPAGQTRYKRMLAKVSEAPECRAVFYKFRDCVAVLKDHLLQELLPEYEQAVRKRKHEAVQAVGKKIEALEDKTAVERMQELRTSHKYKPPKDTGEWNVGPALAIAAASAMLIGTAAFMAFRNYSTKPEQVKSTEYSQRAETPKESDYVGAAQK
jgi:hypothetical protein